MTNNDRDTRTLIVCFVIALVALVPMSIREIWQENWNRVAVLGEETVVPEDEVFEEIETEVYTQAEEMPADEEIIDEVWDESWQMGEDEIVLPNAN
jgi:hypothetical protein